MGEGIDMLTSVFEDLKRYVVRRAFAAVRELTRRSLAGTFSAAIDSSVLTRSISISQAHFLIHEYICDFSPLFTKTDSG